MSSIEVIKADFDNDESIKKMCDRAKLVINCVGPYRFFGEKIVKQCVSSGTHHVDVSGEPEVNNYFKKCFKCLEFFKRFSFDF